MREVGPPACPGCRVQGPRHTPLARPLTCLALEVVQAGRQREHGVQVQLIRQVGEVVLDVCGCGRTRSTCFVTATKVEASKRAVVRGCSTHVEVRSCGTHMAAGPVKAAGHMQARNQAPSLFRRCRTAGLSPSARWNRPDQLARS